MVRHSVIRITPGTVSCANTQVFGESFENEYSTTEPSTRFDFSRNRHEAAGGNDLVTRALKSNTLWLTVTYVGLIFLMARAYV